MRRTFFINKDKKNLIQAIQFLKKSDALLVTISREYSEKSPPNNIQEHISLLRDYKEALVLLLKKMELSSEIGVEEVEIVRKKRILFN